MEDTVNWKITKLWACPNTFCCSWSFETARRVIPGWARAPSNGSVPQRESPCLPITILPESVHSCGHRPDYYQGGTRTRYAGHRSWIGHTLSCQILSCCRYWEVCSTQIHPSLLGIWLASGLGRGPKEHHNHLETKPSLFLALNLSPSVSSKFTNNPDLGPLHNSLRGWFMCRSYSC